MKARFQVRPKLMFTCLSSMIFLFLIEALNLTSSDCHWQAKRSDDRSHTETKDSVLSPGRDIGRYGLLHAPLVGLDSARKNVNVHWSIGLVVLKHETKTGVNKPLSQ